MSAFTKLPEPPYYVVIFSSHRAEGDHGYGDMAQRMVELAADQPGFLGVESTRSADGFGITNSYWATQEAITAWRKHAEHQMAIERGQAQWYEHYEVRIALVERAYSKK